jgi:acetyl esterase/lipase
MRRLFLLILTVLLGMPATSAAGQGVPEPAFGTWYRTLQTEKGVIVFVHGGAFMSGDDSIQNIHPAILAMRDRGWSVFSVRYTVVPAVTMEQQVLQVLAAVRSVRRSRPLSSIVLAGHSAGATLATRAALLSPANVQGVINIAGITDFGAWATKPRDVAFGFSSGYVANIALGCQTSGRISEATNCSRTVLARASAVTGVRPDAPFLYMAYGGKDQVVPAAQGYALLRAYSRAGVGKRAWLDVSSVSDHAVRGANRGFIEAFLTLCASKGFSSET